MLLVVYNFATRKSQGDCPQQTVSSVVCVLHVRLAAGNVRARCVQDTVSCGPSAYNLRVAKFTCKSHVKLVLEGFFPFQKEVSNFSPSYLIRLFHFLIWLRCNKLNTYMQIIPRHLKSAVQCVILLLIQASRGS